MPIGGTTALSEREMYDLKLEAASYYAKNKVPEQLEEILNSMFYEKPEDVYGRLSKHFETMALPAKIWKIEGAALMDSTGNPAVGCKVFCTIKNESKLSSSTSLSISPELSVLPPPPPESEEKEATKESIVPSSVRLIETALSDKLKGLCPMNQKEIDCILRKWIDEEESKCQPSTGGDGEEAPRTPTPSSGTKKKPPSGKGKGKPADKPVPSYEPPEFRLQGCSAVGVTSIAVLEAASSFLEKPTFLHLHNVMNPAKPLIFPVPSMNIIGGGKTSPGKLNITKNIFAIAKPGLTMADSVLRLTQVFHQVGKILSSKGPALPPISTTGGFQPNFEKIEQPLDLLQEAVTALGLTAGQDVFIGIECAAHEVFDYGKGKYEIMTGALKSADEIIDYYKDITNRYPAIIAIIDPLRKEDKEQWPKCCETLSEKCFIIGSEAIYGSSHAVNASAIDNRRSSGLIVTPGGRVTLTDITESAKYIRDKDGVVVLASPPGDVCNTVFTDLAVGLNCDIVRFGAPCRGENAERLNRLAEIERFMKDADVSFSYRKKFTFPLIKPPTPPTEEESTIQANSASPDQKKKK